MFVPLKIFTGAVVNAKHLNKLAFDKGFKAFQKGEYFDNPYQKNTWDAKEWQRGQNAAFNMYRERNITRESYREQRS